MKKNYAGEIIRTGLRLLGYQLAFGFLGFMFAPTLIDASPFLRVPLIGLLILLGIALLFMDGSYRGEKDCGLGETLDKLAKKGQYAPSADEDARRYRRMKGIWGALAGAVPMLLLSVFLALTAKPFAYALQDLPGWLSPYLHRPEIGGGVAYLEDVTVVATAADYVRVAVRFVLFPYVGLAGTLNDAGSLLLDRVSPLLTLILPAAAAVGYQFGPRRRAKTVKALEEAKNKPRKRLKKEAKKRLQDKREEKKQLI